MQATQKERSDYLKERIRKQNMEAKKKWASITCRIPIGSKEEIVKRGETINGLVNKLIAEWIAENPETKKDPAQVQEPEQERYFTFPPKAKERTPERPFTIPPVAGERTPEEEEAALEALQKQVNQKIATQKAELTAEEERKRDRTLLTCVPDEVYEKAKEKINNCN